MGIPGPPQPPPGWSIPVLEPTGDGVVEDVFLESLASLSPPPFFFP